MLTFPHVLSTETGRPALAAATGLSGGVYRTVRCHRTIRWVLPDCSVDAYPNGIRGFREIYSGYDLYKG